MGLDCEGNLIDLEKAHHEGHLRAAADLGIRLSFEEAIKKVPAFIGGPDDEVARVIVSLVKEKTGKDYDRSVFLERTRKHYLEILPELSMELRPGVKEAINWFKENEFGIIVGSVTNTSQLRPILEKSGLLKLIGEDNFILREDVDYAKPNPEVWRKAARKLGIETKELLIFDDSPIGMQAAHNAGCLAVAMPVCHEPKIIERLIHEGAARIFTDWREINLEALINNLNHELENKT